MELINAAITNVEAANCTGYNNDCWCNNIACQGQED